MPSHNHSGNVGSSTGATGSGPDSFPLFVTSIGFTGGGGSHTHSLTGSATSSAITLNLLYANIILCSKN